MKNKATEEANEMKRKAYEEANATREGAKSYAEQVLSNLERDIDHIHKVVRNGQNYLAQQKGKQPEQVERQTVNN